MPHNNPPLDHVQQIAAERSLLGAIKEANDRELRAAFGDDLPETLNVDPRHIAQVAILANPDPSKFEEGVDKISLGVKLTDPEFPGLTAYRNIPVVEMRPLEDLAIGGTTPDQAMLVIAKATGLQETKSTGLLSHMASDLSRIEDIRDGRPFLPPLKHQQ
jgi:hypothetical protein